MLQSLSELSQRILTIILTMLHMSDFLLSDILDCIYCCRLDIHNINYAKRSDLNWLVYRVCILVR